MNIPRPRLRTYPPKMHTIHTGDRAGQVCKLSNWLVHYIKKWRDEDLAKADESNMPPYHRNLLSRLWGSQISGSVQKGIDWIDSDGDLLLCMTLNSNPENKRSFIEDRKHFFNWLAEKIDDKDNRALTGMFVW